MYNNSLNPGISYSDNAKMQVKFGGGCLKLAKLMFSHKQVMNIYIVYEINL